MLHGRTDRLPCCFNDPARSSLPSSLTPTLPTPPLPFPPPPVRSHSAFSAFPVCTFVAAGGLLVKSSNLPLSNPTTYFLVGIPVLFSPLAKNPSKSVLMSELSPIRPVQGNVYIITRRPTTTATTGGSFTPCEREREMREREHMCD